jgi:hypothetical protein
LSGAAALKMMASHRVPLAKAESLETRHPAASVALAGMRRRGPNLTACRLIANCWSRDTVEAHCDSIAGSNEHADQQEDGKRSADATAN